MLAITMFEDGERYQSKVWELVFPIRGVVQCRRAISTTLHSKILRRVVCCFIQSVAQWVFANRCWQSELCGLAQPFLLCRPLTRLISSCTLCVFTVVKAFLCMALQMKTCRRLSRDPPAALAWRQLHHLRRPLALLYRRQHLARLRVIFRRW